MLIYVATRMQMSLRRSWGSRCETATAVAVRLGMNDVIEVSAPFGLDDLFNLVVRPTARFQLEKKPIYLERIRSKNWAAAWPGLIIVDC
jgi:hypothetical protein